MEAVAVAMKVVNSYDSGGHCSLGVPLSTRGYGVLEAKECRITASTALCSFCAMDPAELTLVPRKGIHTVSSGLCRAGLVA